jgi:hypothetical protein
MRGWPLRLAKAPPYIEHAVLDGQRLDLHWHAHAVGAGYHGLTAPVDTSSARDGVPWLAPDEAEGTTDINRAARNQQSRDGAVVRPRIPRAQCACQRVDGREAKPLSTCHLREEPPKVQRVSAARHGEDGEVRNRIPVKDFSACSVDCGDEAPWLSTNLRKVAGCVERLS